MSYTQYSKWMSHRGLTNDAVENTLQAFDHAIKQGFECLETDLRISKDRELVLFHDPTLKRICGLPNRVVDLTRSELEKIKLSHNGRILFFDEFIERYAAYNWVFDIKGDTGAETVIKLLEWLNKKNAREWFLAHSYFLFWDASHENLLKKDLPQARIFAREKECWRAGMSILFGIPQLGGIRKGRWYAIPPRVGPISLFRRRLIDIYHRYEAKTIAYLPKTPFEAKQALKIGCDLILTDYPIVSADE